MPDTEQAVNEVESASTPTEPVIEQEVETTTPETAPQETVAPKTQEVTQSQQELDERGIPWKNRAMENERKLRELEDKFKTIEQTNQPKKYTVQELESFALNNPEHRPWVEEEKAKLLQDSILGKVKEETQKEMQAREFELGRQRALEVAISQFPEIAIKDAQGRFVGWNNASPLTQSVARYMQDPDVAKRPDGLIVAAKLAYADQAMSQIQTSQKQVSKLKSQVKKIEQKTFVEGGGKPVSAPLNPVRKAVEQFKTTGSSSDAKSAMGAYLRASGILKE